MHGGINAVKPWMARSRSCDRDIPFIDVHGCTNVVKPWMARNDLNIKKPAEAGLDNQLISTK
jgi:hypothetical protein